MFNQIQSIVVLTLVAGSFLVLNGCKSRAESNRGNLVTEEWLKDDVESAFPPAFGEEKAPLLMVDGGEVRTKKIIQRVIPKEYQGEVIYVKRADLATAPYSDVSKYPFAVYQNLSHVKRYRDEKGTLYQVTSPMHVQVWMEDRQTGDKRGWRAVRSTFSTTLRRYAKAMEERVYGSEG